MVHSRRRFLGGEFFRNWNHRLRSEILFLVLELALTLSEQVVFLYQFTNWGYSTTAHLLQVEFESTWGKVSFSFSLLIVSSLILAASSLTKLYHTFDWSGLFLLVSGIVLLLVRTTSRGYSSHGYSWSAHWYCHLGWICEWRNDLVICWNDCVFGSGSIIISWSCLQWCVLISWSIWLLTIRVESVTSRIPIIPPRIFKTRTTLAIILLVFVHSFSFISGSYYLPLYFQVRGSSPLLSGIELIPFSFGISILSNSRFLTNRINRIRFDVCSSWICSLEDWKLSNDHFLVISFSFFVETLSWQIRLVVLSRSSFLVSPCLLPST